MYIERRSSRLDPQLEAARILAACGVELGADYHTLESSKVDALLAVARARRYRKPKSANGSTGRYFHAYLQRRADPRNFRGFIQP